MNSLTLIKQLIRYGNKSSDRRRELLVSILSEVMPGNGSGKKKDGQQMPNEIKIELKLLQEIITELAERKFHVAKSVVRRGWESNPSTRFCRPLYNRFSTAPTFQHYFAGIIFTKSVYSFRISSIT